jgi:O-antigen ligase
LQGYSVFFKRRFFIVPETIMFVWGMGILFLSGSRISLLSVLAVLAAVALYGSFRIAGWAARLMVRDRADQGVGVASKRRSRVRLGLWIASLVLIAGGLYSAVLVASKIDTRLARVFNTDYRTLLAGGNGGVYRLANALAYAERVMYWTTAYRAFSLHPVLGVGLGNTGFLFRETLPAFGYSLPEMIRIVNGSPEFPNAKNLWFRLMGETGILGFLTFVSWLVVLAVGARTAMAKREPIAAVLGLAGLLALGALVTEGFSLDTFALPQLWIVLGLLTAAIGLPDRSQKPAR